MKTEQRPRTFSEFCERIAEILSMHGFSEIADAHRMGKLGSRCVFKGDVCLYFAFTYEHREGYISIEFGKNLETKALDEKSQRYSLSGPYSSFLKQLGVESYYKNFRRGDPRSREEYFQETLDYIAETIGPVAEKCRPEDIAAVEQYFEERRRIEMMKMEKPR